MDEIDLELLQFEKLHWRHQGAKATAIRERFGLSMNEYVQRLLAIARRPEALALEPVVVNRINRRRRYSA